MSRSSLPLVLLIACATPGEPDRTQAEPGVDAWSLEGGIELADPTPNGDGIAPIQGGGLVRIDADRLAAIDVDGGRIVVFDATNRTLERTIHPTQDSRPIRLEAGRGLLFASLPGTHEVAAWDVETGAFAWATPACTEPRGLDLAAGKLYVACQSGEVVVLSADTGAEVQRRFLGFEHDDLRDISVATDHVFVSRFRSARVQLLDRDSLALVDDFAPPVLYSANANFPLQEDSRFAPRVAWRMIPTPSGEGVILLHQRHELGPVAISSNDDGNDSPYGGGGAAHCGGIVHTTWTEFAVAGPLGMGPVVPQATMVDLAQGSAMDLLVAGPSWSASRSVPAG